jgi:peptidoglycan hydrolase CwlO-like protein
LECHEENVRNLEQLLESLIKMVGKANQKIDSLQTRVGQLEWLMKEQQLAVRDSGPIRIYHRSPHERPEDFPFHL